MGSSCVNPKWPTHSLRAIAHAMTGGLGKRGSHLQYKEMMLISFSESGSNTPRGRRFFPICELKISACAEQLLQLFLHWPYETLSKCCSLLKDVCSNDMTVRWGATNKPRSDGPLCRLNDCWTAYLSTPAKLCAREASFLKVISKVSIKKWHVMAGQGFALSSTLTMTMGIIVELL